MIAPNIMEHQETPTVSTVLQDARPGRRHPLWHEEMEESAAFEWQGTQPVFIVALEVESGDERRFKKAGLRLALSRLGPAVVVAVEWKDWATLAAPFHAALAAVNDLPPDRHPAIPESHSGAGMGLIFHLVDVESGRFVAERRISLHPIFAGALLSEARRQLAEGVDPDAYAAAVDAFYDDLEDPDDLFHAPLAHDRAR